MRKYSFNAKEFNKDDFYYTYSPIAKAHKEFELRDDCIANYTIGSEDKYSYISLLTKEKFHSGSKISIKCEFGKYGAPLIAFTNDISDNNDGTKLYGVHYEVVAYEGGCNIWKVEPFPERKERPIKPTKLGYAEFEIKENTVIDISAEIIGSKIKVVINGVVIECEDIDVPESFHAGITACEGPNKFYEMTIE